jgi:hypothetical protein
MVKEFGNIGVLGFFERNKQSTMEVRGDLNRYRRTECIGKKMTCLRCKLWILKGKEAGS